MPSLFAYLDPESVKVIAAPRSTHTIVHFVYVEYSPKLFTFRR